MLLSPGLFDHRSSLPSHRGDKFRPPLKDASVAGQLHAGGIRCGNPTPDNPKELCCSSADPYRCVAWLSAHRSFSAAGEVQPPAITAITAFETNGGSCGGIVRSPRRGNEDVEIFVDPVGSDVGGHRKLPAKCHIGIQTVDNRFECHATSPPPNASPRLVPRPTLVVGGDVRQLLEQRSGA